MAKSGIGAIGVAVTVLATLLSFDGAESVDGLKVNIFNLFRSSRSPSPPKVVYSEAEIAWHKFVQEYDYNMWRVASKKSFLTNGGNYHITENYEIKKTNLNDFDLPQRFTIEEKDGKDMIKTSFVLNINKRKPFYYSIPELFPDVPSVANALVHKWNSQHEVKIDIEDSQSALPPSLGVTADFFVKNGAVCKFDKFTMYGSIWGLSMFQDANSDGRLNVSVDENGKPTGVRKLQTLDNEGVLLRSVTGEVQNVDGKTGTPVLKNLANLKEFMEKSLNFGAAGAKNGQHQWIEIYGFSGWSNVFLNKMHYRYRDHDGSREYKTIQDVKDAIQKFEEYRQIRKLVEEDDTKSTTTSSADAYQRIITENRKPVVTVRILGGLDKSKKLSSLKLPLLYNVEIVEAAASVKDKILSLTENISRSRVQISSRDEHQHRAADEANVKPVTEPMRVVLSREQGLDEDINGAHEQQQHLLAERENRKIKIFVSPYYTELVPQSDVEKYNINGENGDRELLLRSHPEGDNKNKYIAHMVVAGADVRDSHEVKIQKGDESERQNGEKVSVDEDEPVTQKHSMESSWEQLSLSSFLPFKQLRGLALPFNNRNRLSLRRSSAAKSKKDPSRRETQLNAGNAHAVRLHPQRPVNVELIKGDLPTDAEADHISDLASQVEGTLIDDAQLHLLHRNPKKIVAPVTGNVVGDARIEDGDDDEVSEINSAAFGGSGLSFFGNYVRPRPHSAPPAVFAKTLQTTLMSKLERARLAKRSQVFLRDSQHDLENGVSEKDTGDLDPDARGGRLSPTDSRPSSSVDGSEGASMSELADESSDLGSEAGTEFQVEASSGRGIDEAAAEAVVSPAKAAESKGGVAEYSLKQLIALKEAYDNQKAPLLPTGVDRNALEEQLSDTDFEQLFGKTRQEFNKLKPWKKDQMKKNVGLF